MTIQKLTGHYLLLTNFRHLHPLSFTTRSSAGDLSRPPNPENQGGGSLTGGSFFERGNPVRKKFARSEQLRDRLATFGQKG